MKIATFIINFSIFFSETPAEPIVSDHMAELTELKEQVISDITIVLC